MFEAGDAPLRARRVARGLERRLPGVVLRVRSESDDPVAIARDMAWCEACVTVADSEWTDERPIVLQRRLAQISACPAPVVLVGLRLGTITSALTRSALRDALCRVVWVQACDASTVAELRGVAVHATVEVGVDPIVDEAPPGPPPPERPTLIVALHGADARRSAAIDAEAARWIAEGGDPGGHAVERHTPGALDPSAVRGAAGAVVDDRGDAAVCAASGVRTLLLDRDGRAEGEGRALGVRVARADAPEALDGWQQAPRPEPLAHKAAAQLDRVAACLRPDARRAARGAVLRRVRALVDTILAKGGPRVLVVGEPEHAATVSGMLGAGFVVGFTTVAHLVDEAPARRFDVVAVVDAIERAEAHAPVLAAARERLIHGGLAVFTVPNVTHFSRHVAPLPWPDGWRLRATPDEVALALGPAGFTLSRAYAPSVGYAPLDDTIEGEPTDLERDGDQRVDAALALRLGHHHILVARAGGAEPGLADVDALARAGQDVDAVRLALDLTRRVPWSPRGWLVAAARVAHAGHLAEAARFEARARALDPARTRDLNLALAPSGDRLRDAEQALLDDPGLDDRWDALEAALVAAGRRHAAAGVLSLRRRNAGWR